MDEQLRLALVALLDALEAIGKQHEEVYDTDVRERMADAIERGEVPASLGMFSDEGNRAVAAALHAYLSVARSHASALGLDADGRRAAVWNEEVTSSSGAPVDDFLGWPY